jgi:hypothetical protein
LGALWLEGYEMPGVLGEGRASAAVAQVATTRPEAMSAATGRHWYTGGLLVRGQDVHVAACYLAYFGLVFGLLRWWKLADRRRSSRFSFFSMAVTAMFAGLIMLLLWPSDETAKSALIDSTTAIMVPVMASAVIQLVSPWEAPPPRRSRKLRLANA